MFLQIVIGCNQLEPYILGISDVAEIESTDLKEIEMSDDDCDEQDERSDIENMLDKITEATLTKCYTINKKKNSYTKHVDCSCSTYVCVLKVDTPKLNIANLLNKIRMI